MFSLLQSVFLYLLLPVGAIILGGLAATIRKPGQGLQSAIQHFAAGVVFAAVAVELLPQELNEHRPVPLISGFAAGVAFMLGVEWLIKRLSSEPVAGQARLELASGAQAGETSYVAQAVQAAQGGEAAQVVRAEQPTGLLVAVAVDLAVDGLLIGVGFAAGAKQGILITIALTLEVLFVGTSVACEYADIGASRGKIFGVTAGLAAIIGTGAVIGLTFLGGLSGAPLAFVLAFGSAALLYLVTEELLVEAHETLDTPPITAAFFAGFLVLLIIDELA